MSAPAAADLYLDLLKRALMNTLYRDPAITGGQQRPYDEAERLEGKDWPRDALTMIGARRLDNLAFACRSVIEEGVPGDFIEAGVWRGGAGALMRGVLAAYGVADRKVILADSFEGLPKPDAAAFPQDAKDEYWRFTELAVSREQVAANIARFGLLDAQIVFLKGWFKDTLHAAPTQQIAVARLDGDMYESTWQALEALYPRCAPGAFVILDDYGCVPGCKAAVSDYRAQHGIDDPITEIDWTGVYWRKAR